MFVWLQLSRWHTICRANNNSNNSRQQHAHVDLFKLAKMLAFAAFIDCAFKHYRHQLAYIYLYTLVTVSHLSMCFDVYAAAVLRTHAN